MGLLNDIGSAAGDALSAVDGLLSSSPLHSPKDFEKDGFIVPPIPSADGNGLPSQKIRSGRYARATRQMAHWFVPEVGVIPMYINPKSIVYSNSKLINKERTKGGWSIQYWGENLGELTITGHTGSSGFEGLNVLYEIYRAEQYMFDSIALTMAADSSVSGLGDLVDGALGGIGGDIGGVLGAATGGLLGLDPVSQNILPRDVPSLAAMALGVELYYQGLVFRGFFESFNFTESIDRLGLFDYDIRFTVTQRRGYRVNNLPWQRSAVSGPSNADAIPLSFVGLEGARDFTKVKGSAGT